MSEIAIGRVAFHHCRIEKNAETKVAYQNETAAGRLAYSCLGYWGARLPLKLGNRLGIRQIKNLPAEDFTTIAEVSEALIGRNIVTLCHHLEIYNVHRQYDDNLYLSLLKDPIWKDIKGRKDLYIKGAGKPRHKIQLCWGNTRQLRWSQYFEYPYGLSKISDEDLLRVVQLDFPESRLDELAFAKLAGLDIHRNKLAVILKRLDYIIERGMKATYRDSYTIEYKHKERLESVAQANNMVLPSNGKNLKAAALHFKNCAASYIDKVLEGKTVIMYNNEHMAQVSIDGTKVIQFYGKRNSKPTVEFKYV